MIRAFDQVATEQIVELVRKHANQFSEDLANICRKKALFAAYLKVFSPVEMPLKILEVILITIKIIN